MTTATTISRTEPSTYAASAGESACAFSPRLVTLSEPQSEQAEAIRAIRTHVMAQHIERGRRALAVCAPNKGVGCTFVAANLAMSLSQIGVKTVLIDGDLNNPSVSDLIRPAAPRGGLAACLSSQGALGECIDFEVARNLSVILAGHAVANSRELLAGDRFQMLMDFCLRDFDVTIVDTPPANGSSDVRRISTVLGYSLIVAGSNRTYVNDVKTLAEQLRSDHAKVLGTVLNWA
jgi:capsular exopolysaccharide synthesis family protein